MYTRVWSSRNVTKTWTNKNKSLLVCKKLYTSDFTEKSFTNIHLDNLFSVFNF